MTVWKLGCRWGKGKPPLFFDLLIKYRIVNSLPYKRFAIGDWVLLTDGYTVLGFAEVIGKPLKIADNPSLASEFGKRDVPNTVDVYDANVWELAVEDWFKYNAQHGIVQIHKQDILDNFDKIRRKYSETSFPIGPVIGPVITPNKEDVIRNLLEINKNIILHGAPGTGKTHTARHLYDGYNNVVVDFQKGFVQFHPSYDYTDFVEGLRPVNLPGGQIGFERRDGIFKAFCKLALNDPEKKYIFIIDEINRGDLSKIFGELFFAIDPGYRGTKGRTSTQYQNLIDDKNDSFFNGFYVPENVYIIGTMNDIDRSVESMDFAIRRRFVFIEITAQKSQSMLTNAFNKISAKNANLDMVNEIKSKMDALNAEIISEEIGLSPDYQIGAAYFLNYALYANESNPFDLLWDYHLKNILTEYVRGTGGESSKFDKLKTAYDNA